MLDTLILGGALTVKQLVVIIIALAAIGLILKLAKKTIKLILSTVIIVGVLIYTGVVSPDKLADVQTVIKDTGMSTVQNIANSSDKIKIDNTDGTKILISDGKKWYNIEEIKKVAISDNGVSILLENGDTVEIEDKNVAKLLEIFKK